MFDRWLSVIEILLLVWIVVQGEYIRYYEREVHRLHSYREKERLEWREKKRKQTIKKTETPNI
jgi:hypothetical protein